MASQIIPDLLAEAARSPELAEALRTALHESQQSMAAAMVERAVERGEIPAGVDGKLALDLLTGPLYWRLVVVRDDLPAGYLDALAQSVAAALGAE